MHATLSYLTWVLVMGLRSSSSRGKHFTDLNRLPRPPLWLSHTMFFTLFTLPCDLPPTRQLSRWGTRFSSIVFQQLPRAPKHRVPVPRPSVQAVLSSSPFQRTLPPKSPASEPVPCTHVWQHAFLCIAEIPQRWGTEADGGYCL